MNNEGFTLIELIAVMIVLAVMATIAIVKFIDFDDTAEQQALNTAIRILNTNEKMVWSDIKISTGWVGDEETASAVEYDLGDKFKWLNGPNLDGGILGMTSAKVNLKRSPSTNANPAIWERI